MDKRIGVISDKLRRGYSHCERCKTNWAFVDPHITNYNEAEGIFALCEDCWNELTPDKRLPYYVTVATKIKSINNDILNDIIAAVENGE